jgi:hypothetical protein
MGMKIELLVNPPGATRLQISQINRDLEESLGRRLRGAGYPAEADSLKLIRPNPNEMDLGSVVGVALAAPAIVELARGIAAYLARLAPAERKIVISHGSTKVDLTNPKPEELVRALESFNRVAVGSNNAT